MDMELLQEKINDAIKKYTFEKSSKQDWCEYCKQYAITAAELSGIYDPEHDEIEAIPVPTEEDEIWTVYVHVKKSPIEVITINLTVSNPN